VARHALAQCLNLNTSFLGGLRMLFAMRRTCVLLFALVALNLLLLAVPPVEATALESSSAISYAPDTAFNPNVTNLSTTTNARQKFGIATHPWWLDMFLDRFITYFKDLKITTVRLPYEWKVFEPQEGVFDFSREDRILNRLRDEGFEVVAEFVTVPPWASANKEECVRSDVYCRLDPSKSAQLARAAQMSAQRYPFIRNWEFWNEPDMWPNFGRSDIGDYAPWLKVFYDAIKQVDPTLLVAATSQSGYDYMDWLYNYSDATFGMHPWDAVAYHPYTTEYCHMDAKTRRVSLNFNGVERLRELMVQHGDGNQPMWLTEMGWLGTPEDQTTCLKESFDYVATRPFITMGLVHMLHDWELEQFGLMKVKQSIIDKRPLQSGDEFVPKQPYYDAYKYYDKSPLPSCPTATITANTLVFTATRHTVTGVFKGAWERGSLTLFGFPQTGQFYERNPADNNYYLVQYFERGRMEYHPEFKGTPNEVMFGLLGNQLLIERGWLNSNGLPIAGATLPEAKPARTGANLMWFRETQHTLSGAFLQAWNKQGGLAIVGLPKTQVFEERNPDDGGTYQVQYFERARMELHPGKNGQPDIVLFGLLGNERLRLQSRLLGDNQPNLGAYYNPALPEFRV